MSDDDKQTRFKTVVSLKSMLEAAAAAIRTEIAGLENLLKKEKVAYKKKIIKTRILELYGELDEYANKYSTMTIEQELLESLGLII